MDEKSQKYRCRYDANHKKFYEVSKKRFEKRNGAWYVKKDK